jgi:uncharacterized protein
MSGMNKLKKLTRRAFTAALSAGGAMPLLAEGPQGRGLPPERAPFSGSLTFRRAVVPPKVAAFPLTDVRLLPSVYRQSQQANLGYLKRLDPDRLLHNFRVNCGLVSDAKPLGGWEKPDCELRGHFVGHYLSACALMHASTGEADLKARGDYLVRELAKCQAKLPDGYLSAFPLEFFDRLNARRKVWAPFYTIHKIMAGMCDMHEHCANSEALDVVQRMAQWADKWTAPIPEPHMQDILNTEYGGMNDVLYKISGLTGEDHYATIGDRFTKKKFFNPLALRRDELRGLHVNTHIPQVIGAAARYDISADERFRDLVEFFWWEVTTARAYVTGGTSNAELWLVEPRRLGEELRKSSDTTECCCAYNMLKLTRHLYQWTGDPRYFDYYERTLLNHRIAAIDRRSGASQYYLSIVPGAWKTFSTEDDSFWCCTGTGVEEFSKLNDSIYFHDANDLYVNLFIPSELNWRDKGLLIQQETDFPNSGAIRLNVKASSRVRAPIHIRVPYWAGPDASVKVNGKTVEATPSPAGYFTLTQSWQTGDRIEMQLRMYLHREALPDEPQTQAFLYGPFVLAGKLGKQGLSAATVIGPEGPEVNKHSIVTPALRASNQNLEWLRSVPGELAFQAAGQEQPVTFAPFDSLFDERYSVYWQVT